MQFQNLHRIHQELACLYKRYNILALTGFHGLLGLRTARSEIVREFVIFSGPVRGPKLYAGSGSGPVLGPEPNRSVRVQPVLVRGSLTVVAKVYGHLKYF